MDNHDVTRVASILNNENHLPLIYALCFGMPGIPCVYYGSEWGFKARKEDGDPALRPAFKEPEWNKLTDYIQRLASAVHEAKALSYGDFNSIILTNEQCAFLREWEGERVLVCINASENPFYMNFDLGVASGTDLISGDKIEFNNGFEIKGYSAHYLRL